MAIAPGHAPQRLAVLDGLRMVAALAVLAHHAVAQPRQILGSAHGNPLPWADVWAGTGALHMLMRGYLFVDLFFLLSGFVLALRFDRALGTNLAAWRFMGMRVRRLWPLAALGTVLGGAAALAGPAADAGTTARLLLMALLFVPQWRGNGNCYPLNSPQWSLALEFFANAVHALLLCRLSNQALLVVVAISGLVLAIMIGFNAGVGFGPSADSLLMAVPRTLYPYALGCWMARQWQAGHRPWHALPWPLTVLLPLALVLAVGLLPPTAAYADSLCALVLLPLLLWLAATATLPTPGAGAVLRALGTVSFPLYAVHVPILHLAVMLAPAAGWHVASASWAGAAAALVLAVVLARGPWSARPMPHRQKPRAVAGTGSVPGATPAG
ncbi:MULTISPECIES: acyltransferase [unclassified Novosphingobium]|uniref:acyltransferase family protein n=1 Tax=unclassified Novosphingobium TaxID=2644732 RepID=UPI002105BFB6|nr:MULTISPECIES: acyltransferase family protein [unclassified Novosphingobium]